jgi:hypothetical protein
MRIGQRIMIVGVGLLVGTASLWAQTYVSGNVFGVWNAVGNPYIVEDDLYISFDKTLRINEGVEIYFLWNDSVSVYGRLVVAGSVSNPVVFSCHSSSTNYWKGIYFHEDALNDGEIDYAMISGSYIGVSVFRCDVEVRNSDIDVLYRGLELIESDAIYQNNNIRCNYPTVTGIYLQKSNAKLLDNVIDVYGTSSYVSYGINADYCPTATMENNMVRTECIGPAYGIRFSNSYDIRITYNLVECYSENTATGVFAVNSNNPRIRNNTIIIASPGTDKGIYCVNAHPTITNNILVGDGIGNNHGISCVDNSQPVISYNDIWNINIPHVGCLPGEHDIFLDPSFVGGDPYDYHLRWGSPCIDTGNPVYYDPDGTRSDMGAFYYHQTSVPESEVPVIPTHHQLGANYPNPFNSETMVPFSVGHRIHVTIDIYNVMGQRVSRIMEGILDAGEYRIPWSAGSLPSGVYICRMQAGDESFQRKVILLR